MFTPGKPFFLNQCFQVILLGTLVLSNFPEKKIPIMYKFHKNSLQEYLDWTRMKSEVTFTLYINHYSLTVDGGKHRIFAVNRGKWETAIKLGWGVSGIESSGCKGFIMNWNPFDLSTNDLVPISWCAHDSLHCWKSTSQQPEDCTKQLFRIVHTIRKHHSHVYMYMHLKLRYTAAQSSLENDTNM